MAYQSISHTRSHRVPFHGLGRGPGYMGSLAGAGMGAARAAGGGAAGGGAAAWAGVAEQGLKTTATIIDAAQGGYQKRERESKRNLEIARLQAQSAAGNAAAQVEMARLQAEAAVAAARIAGQSSGGMNKTLLIGGGIAVLVALLGIGAVVLLKQK